MSKDKEIVAWGYAPGTWMQNNWLKYKLTREKWQEFWVAQDGRCGGCGEPLAHPLQRDTIGIFGWMGWSSNAGRRM